MEFSWQTMEIDMLVVDVVTQNGKAKNRVKFLEFKVRKT
jgi:hypothetical protein